MKIAIRLPIGVKMSAVCVAVVLGGMVPTAFMVSAAFKKRAQDREEDANRAQAEARVVECAQCVEIAVRARRLCCVFHVELLRFFCLRFNRSPPRKRLPARRRDEGAPSPMRPPPPL